MPYDQYGGYAVSPVAPVAPSGYAPVQVGRISQTELLKARQ